MNAHPLRRTLVYLFATLLVLSVGSCDFLDDILGPDEDDDPPASGEIGEVLWTHDISALDDGTLAIGGSLALGDDGTVYYSAAGGTIHWTPARIVALDPADGTVKWQSPELDHIALSSQIVVGDDGTVYAIGYHKLYAIDPATGAFEWEWEVPTELPNPDDPDQNVYTYGQIGALALTNEGDLVLGSIGSGAYHRGLYRVSTAGQKVWHNLRANGAGIASGLTVGSDNVLYYYTRRDGLNLMAVAGGSGSILWSRPVAATGSGANNVIIDGDGAVIAAFRDQDDDPYRMYRLDPADGSVAWTSAAEATSTAKVVDASGMVYQFNAPGGGIWKFDASAGSLMSFNEEMGTGWIGAIDRSGDLITANTIRPERRLTTFTADGDTDWYTPIAGLLRGPFVVSGSGVIYGIVNQHPVSRWPTQIVAVQGNTGLATSGWPRRYHDNRNTSNWSKH